MFHLNLENLDLLVKEVDLGKLDSLEPQAPLEYLVLLDYQEVHQICQCIISNWLWQMQAMTKDQVVLAIRQMRSTIYKRKLDLLDQEDFQVLLDQ